MGKNTNETGNNIIRVGIAKKLGYQIIPIMGKERQELAKWFREAGLDEEAKKVED
jgi:hypothetical protein